MCACINGCIEVVKYLLKCDESLVNYDDIDAKGKKKTRSILMEAINRGRE